ncbi:helix-turn-helix domain-containing protein [Jannaschia marina]|uniref:helix-turn-helix domain-containing protein n=1 Tax=Jannaschia marina TaxID=2741674 RepID=UPI0015C84347|nr:AraC family transcriptional regulator [Jannaschia marina]
MTSGETLQFAADMFLMGLSAICAIQLFQRQEDRRVYLPLALFFTAQVAILVPTLLDRTIAGSEPALALRLATAASLPIITTMAPLFWLYVRMLTSETPELRLRSLLWHLPPIVLAGAAGATYLLVSASTLAVLDQGQVAEGAVVMLATILVYTATVVFYFQVLFYLLWTLRILYLYNSRLKDLFASTESRELGWVWWIAVAGMMYWVTSIAHLLAPLAVEDLSPAFAFALGFADVELIGVIAVWGLRQRPGLSASEMEKSVRSEEVAPKYSRSALTDADMGRISTKIDAAMRQDQLYDDPNLSLWDLATHIGVSTNYVSQTLNFVMKRNFFDYVNGFRIRRAVEVLLGSDATILSIAHDVGFNSRSSFYRAFRQELGMTPMELRKQWKEEQAEGSASEHAFIDKLSWAGAG